jgi:hypothetical protein
VVAMGISAIVESGMAPLLREGRTRLGCGYRPSPV